MTTKAEAIKKQIEEHAVDPFLQGANLDTRGFSLTGERLGLIDLNGEFTPDPRFAGLARESTEGLRTAIPAMADRDEEMQAELRKRGVVDEGQPHKFYLSTGDEAQVFLGKDNVWRVTVFFDGRQQTIKCAMARSRDEAMTGANRWLDSKRGPQIRALSKDQELYIARLAGMGKREDAILNFLADSVPDYEGTDISSDPKYTDICNRCAWFVFIHSTPQYADSETARAFMSQYMGDRPITVELLQFAFAAYREHEKKAERGLILGQIEDRENQAESAPTYEELDELSTEEITTLREQTLRDRAKKVRGGILQ